jgi:predicted transcriptional regulator of viral defense system
MCESYIYGTQSIVAPTIQGIGSKEREKLSAVLAQAKGPLSVDLVEKTLGIGRSTASWLLSNWARKGWLVRLKRGVYAPVPMGARTADIPLEDPWAVVPSMFAPCYIGGWSAAEHWGLTEQLFRTIIVVSSKPVRDRKPVVQGTSFWIKTVRPEALFGTKSVWRGTVRLDVSTPTRTVLDLLDDPALGGGMRSATDMFANYLKSDDRDMHGLADAADRLGNKTVFKRLGFLLERMAPEEENVIRRCRQAMSKGDSQLDPALPAELLVTRWRLWIPTSWKRSDDR